MHFQTSEWPNLLLIPFFPSILLFLPWSPPQAHLDMASLLPDNGHFDHLPNQTLFLLGDGVRAILIRHRRWRCALVCMDMTGFIEGVGLCDIKWVKVELDGTLGPGGEGHTVKGHYSSVVQALADTLHHPLPSLSLCLSTQFPCRGWSPETRLGLIYSPSLLSPAWLPLQWRNFLSLCLSGHSSSSSSGTKAGEAGEWE